MLPTHRPPTMPGEMLLEEFLRPRGITQVELAARMGVPVQRINTLINGKRGVTAETALLLSDVLDTTPEFWMGLQADFDLWHARQRHERRTLFRQSKVRRASPRKPAAPVATGRRLAYGRASSMSVTERGS